MEALSSADAMLARLARILPVHMMPGPEEPTNVSLPQMPIHPMLLPQTRASCHGTFRPVSNPYSSRVDEVRVLGHSGQPVQDMMRCTRLSTPLAALTTCLDSLHLAPTAPDTLPVQPFRGHDPLVINEVPQVFFSGGHTQAAWQWRVTGCGSSAHGTTCICVPAFRSQPAIVLVSLHDPRDVRVQEFSGPEAFEA